MLSNPKAAMALLAGILFAWVTPANGQIASVVDADGKVVYVNASPAPARNGRRAASGKARASSARAIPREELERMAREAAERHKVDPVLVSALIDAESSWDPQAVSSKGAQGLMQLIPETADELGVQDPFDPEQNLDGGVRHLRSLLEKYDGDLDRALAAYNAGAGAVDRAGGVPNYRETRLYVQKVTDSYFRPGSGRAARVLKQTRAIYRTVDERGRLVFTNE